MALGLLLLLQLQPILVPPHLVVGHDLVQLAEDDGADWAGQRHEPALDADGDAAEAQDLVREEGDEDGRVQGYLRGDDGLLHLGVPQEVPVEGLVEGPRNVGADVLREDERDEGHSPCVGKLCLVFEPHDALLEDLAVAEEEQRAGVDGEDYSREDRAVHEGALPHPAEHDGLLLGPRPHLEDGLVARLHAQGDGGRQVRDQDQEEDLQGRAHHRDLEDHADEDLQDLGDVHRHDEGDELLDARVDCPAFLDRGDDGAEVVVRQDHLGGALGDLGALDAHGHSDVSLVKGRRIIDAVTRHGADITLPLEGLHNLDLVLRLRAREALGALRDGVDLRGAEVAAVRPQVFAVRGRALVVVGPQDPDVLCDGYGGLEVVACDHDHADAGALRQGHGLLDAVAVRVPGGDEAHELQVLAALLKLLVGVHRIVFGVEGHVGHRVYSHRKHPQGAGGVLVDGVEDGGLLLLGQRPDLARLRDPLVAHVQDVVRRALADAQVARARGQRHAAGAELRAA
mmetsp:Transcript_41234/g.117651  ORF Transcript_41234/g.117651 Transcript_41234/m.117651 type:complete len:512 (-) Transcript_41234:236-1771(-)